MHWGYPSYQLLYWGMGCIYWGERYKWSDQGNECERDDNSSKKDTTEIEFFYDGVVDKDSNKLGLGGIALKRDGQVLVQFSKLK